MRAAKFSAVSPGLRGDDAAAATGAGRAPPPGVTCGRSRACAGTCPSRSPRPGPRREDQPERRAADPDRRQPERPFLAARRCGRDRQAVDRACLEASGLDRVVPGRAQHLLEALAARASSAASNSRRRLPSPGAAEHRLRRVLERQPLRRLERDAEPAVDEAAAADQPVARIVAVGEPLDGREIAAPIALADARGARAARGLQARARCVPPCSDGSRACRQAWADSGPCRRRSVPSAVRKRGAPNGSNPARARTFTPA